MVDLTCLEQVIRMLEEPTAAALAFGLHRKPNVNHILVYDLGGGTLDVSLLFVNDGSVEVLGSDGDDNLGGKALSFSRLFVAKLVHMPVGNRVVNLCPQLPRARPTVFFLCVLVGRIYRLFVRPPTFVPTPRHLSARRDEPVHWCLFICLQCYTLPLCAARLTTAWLQSGTIRI